MVLAAGWKPDRNGAKTVAEEAHDQQRKNKTAAKHSPDQLR